MTGYVESAPTFSRKLRPYSTQRVAPCETATEWVPSEISARECHLLPSTYWTIMPLTAADALDDVVDGIAEVTVVDAAALEWFQQYKPGRFAKLRKEARADSIFFRGVRHALGAHATVRRG